MASKVFNKRKKSTIDSVDKSAAKMNLTTSSANIIQGMTDEGEHLVLITNFHFMTHITLAKTEIIYPKNVGTLIAMNFT